MDCDSILTVTVVSDLRSCRNTVIDWIEDTFRLITEYISMETLCRWSTHFHLRIDVVAEMLTVTLALAKCLFLGRKTSEMQLSASSVKVMEEFKWPFVVTLWSWIWSKLKEPSWLYCIWCHNTSSNFLFTSGFVCIWKRLELSKIQSVFNLDIEMDWNVNCGTKFWANHLNNSSF